MTGKLTHVRFTLATPRKAVLLMGSLESDPPLVDALECVTQQLGNADGAVRAQDAEALLRDLQRLWTTPVEDLGEDALLAVDRANEAIDLVLLCPHTLRRTEDGHLRDRVRRHRNTITRLVNTRRERDHVGSDSVVSLDELLLDVACRDDSPRADLRRARELALQCQGAWQSAAARQRWRRRPVHAWCHALWYPTRRTRHFFFMAVADSNEIQSTFHAARPYGAYPDGEVPPELARRNPLGAA